MESLDIFSQTVADPFGSEIPILPSISIFISGEVDSNLLVIIRTAARLISPRYNEVSCSGYRSRFSLHIFWGRKSLAESYWIYIYMFCKFVDKKGYRKWKVAWIRLYFKDLYHWGVKLYRNYSCTDKNRLEDNKIKRLL